jgi:hypothetical protein
MTYAQKYGSANASHSMQPTAPPKQVHPSGKKKTVSRGTVLEVIQVRNGNAHHAMSTTGQKGQNAVG